MDYLLTKLNKKRKKKKAFSINSMENISFPKNLSIIFTIIFYTAHTKHEHKQWQNLDLTAGAGAYPYIYLSVSPLSTNFLHDLKSKYYKKIDWYMKLSSIFWGQVFDL